VTQNLKSRIKLTRTVQFTVGTNGTCIIFLVPMLMALFRLFIIDSYFTLVQYFVFNFDIVPFLFLKEIGLINKPTIYHMCEYVIVFASFRVMGTWCYVDA